ncbi:MAG: alpha-2-macroglobulin family protein [Thermoanaerobaculia bacterium]
MDHETAWKEVEELVADQRLEAAFSKVQEALRAARESGNEQEWTRALIEGANLRIALHGFEDAVRYLKDQPWPDSELHRSLLQLFYASSLTTYVQAYSWEIEGRERVALEGEVDLKQWTKDQILAEADRAFYAVWSRREEWGTEPIGAWGAYLQKNNYPPGIRSTLRDLVTYLWVQMSSNSANWTASELNEVFRLPFEELLEGEAAALLEGLESPDRHPLYKMAGLLADLESWHADETRPEASFEARLERSRRLQAVFSESQFVEERRSIRENLRHHLEVLGRSYPWWSMGQSLLAELIRAEADPNALVEAREVALEGARFHRGSIGAKRCQRLVAEIEAPDYSLTAMQSDGPRRRSIHVGHRNLGVLYFRAYRLDLLETLAASRDYNLLPAHREVDEIVGSGVPVAEWKVELPQTPDFRTHTTYATAPMADPGLYVIVASVREDFRESRNRRMALNLLITDMVLVSRQRGDALEVIVRSGADGRRLPGVEVALYRFDYKRGHRRVASRTTDDSGSTTFRVSSQRSDSHFLVARQEGDYALDSRRMWIGGPQPSPDTSTSALIYTDRSVYRPLQKVLWKVVGYQRSPDADRFQTLPQERMTVDLLDSNGESVESVEVETNEFGTASGAFTVPAGRLLGRWSLRTSLGGWSQVTIEEYKRPTFEVTLVDPVEPVRLNRPASLSGEVRYYFGLPVVTGQVAWHVSRVPVFPRWMGWYRTYPTQVPETIASGTAELDTDGRFEISFLPAADERLAATAGLSYRYKLTAAVTDEGGETRSAERLFRLGFVAVEATVEAAKTFFTVGDRVEILLARKDLNGVGRAGSADWSLTKVEQPDSTAAPAEIPKQIAPGDEDRFRTPGDLLRPRWAADYSFESLLASWSDGEVVRRGTVEHGEDGSASVLLVDLPPDVYRLHYSTEDEFGSVFETRRDLLVVGEGLGRLELPALLLAERQSSEVGETLKVLVHSGLEDQELLLELQSSGETIEQRLLQSGAGPVVLEFPVDSSRRGGFSFLLSTLVDYQFISASQAIWVPWEDRELQLAFSSFRDLLRPGSQETWRVTVSSSDGRRLERGAAELLAYMYDRSLDLFAPHNPPSVLSLYPTRTETLSFQTSLGSAGAVWQSSPGFVVFPEYPHLHGDQLRFLDGYGIGGPGKRRGYALADMAPAALQESEVAEQSSLEEVGKVAAKSLPGEVGGSQEAGNAIELRSEFSETAFWHPHLVVEDEGAVSFEFTVPDSVTEWNVWLHALDRDLRGGSFQRQVRTVKELMVRPYLPRFLREGDQVDLAVVVNNAGETTLHGRLDFEILEPTDESGLNAEFGLGSAETSGVPFSVPAGAGTRLLFPVTVPPRVGNVAFKVTARAGDFSDGELRPLPVLPGRMHLSQSRFVTLRDAERREMSFAELVGEADPSRIDEQLIVTLDAQLFYSVLQALPYLVQYPYECTEQTLNRFLSTGIVSSLYERYPAVARMAKKMADRETRLETWDQVDPNRKMALEETPWLIEAQGGGEDDLINVLKPRVAKAERQAALAKLAKTQTSLGGFPWWSGGPPSPYMTLYIMQGFSRALEFGIEVPQAMVEKGWSYLHRHYLDEIVPRMMDDDCCWEFVTFLNYVLSSYPDESWTRGLFSQEERRKMLDFSFRHWREHSPLLKSSLTLTLSRAGRDADAERVWESVMDSAKTSPDEGTYWAPEERSWLWYNDTIEGHALALRTLTELDPDEPRRAGLVQWLLLNKKLNHWKSTRATAEVIYALVHYLEREGSLAVREEVQVEIGRLTETRVFEPDEYTGWKNQIVIRGSEIEPDSMNTIVVEKQSKGFLFASATWHFSTERLPEKAEGNFFFVERRYFKRLHDGREWVLQPLEDGTRIEPGDQVEVQLSLRSRHAAEYVHLRDPRPAGFEPESTRSAYRWELGIGWYEEVRDSGSNFFFELLPAGEYTFRYRLRASLAGTFRVAPATVQSMYAPEFTAYSAGNLIEIEAASP